MPKKKKHSMATRRLMSLRARGKNNPFYGKHHNAEARRKISRATKGKNNPMYGKHHTQETIRKISLKRRAYLKKLKG